jgi:hypothetical protein
LACKPHNRKNCASERQGGMSASTSCKFAHP